MDVCTGRTHQRGRDAAEVQCLPFHGEFCESRCPVAVHRGGGGVTAVVALVPPCAASVRHCTRVGERNVVEGIGDSVPWRLCTGWTIRRHEVVHARGHKLWVAQHRRFQRGRRSCCILRGDSSFRALCKNGFRFSRQFAGRSFSSPGTIATRTSVVLQRLSTSGCLLSRRRRRATAASRSSGAGLWWG